MPQLIDVTLREVGIANGFSFSLGQVLEITRSLDEAGVDFIEVGYLRELGPGVPLGGGACDAEYLAAVRGAARRARVAAMVHTWEVTEDTYARLREFRVDLVRFTLSRKNAGEIERHAAALRRLGIPFTCNATRATEISLEELIEYGRLSERIGASAFYVADSNGSLLPSQLDQFARGLARELRVPLGFHAHDNLTLALANTLVALSHGFAFIDGSLGGAGKGGGNLCTELICGYFARHHQAPYDLFPLARAYERAVAPAMPQPQARLWSNVFGLLNLNMDQIAELHGEAERRNVSMEHLIRGKYRFPKEDA